MSFWTCLLNLRNLINMHARFFLSLLKRLKWTLIQTHTQSIDALSPTQQVIPCLITFLFTVGWCLRLKTWIISFYRLSTINSLFSASQLSFFWQNRQRLMNIYLILIKNLIQMTRKFLYGPSLWILYFYSRNWSLEPHTLRQIYCQCGECKMN